MGTNRPPPCSFSVTGEWVYLQPVVDNTSFVIKNSDSNRFQQIGPRERHDMDYESGFRIEGMYAFSNCFTDLRVAWTHLETDDTKTVSGEFLHPTKGYPLFTIGSYEGLAKSRLDLDFDRVEGVVGFRVFNSCCFDLVIEGGLHYVSLDTKNDAFYLKESKNIHFVKTDSRYWGIGPQIGVDLYYNFWNCLAVVGRAQGALLVGECETRNVIGDLNSGLTVDSKSTDTWRVVPYFQTRVGLNYDWTFSCLTISLEGGYEFMSYIHPLVNSSAWFNNFDPDVSDFDLPGNSVELYSHANLHGPYVGLTLTY
ncbi:MAG: hypothetical protein K940chlam9_01505 [Chlamydiae bacterium]|nr:hypothetical protein [Chlamydiota bacterium]